jgi:TonB family protein
VTQGTVVVAFERGARNRAGDVLVLESTDSRFADAALDAIREWRFAAHASGGGVVEDAPVVRFLFTTGSIAVVPLTAGPRTGDRRTIRADSAVELPNFSHLDAPPKALASPAPGFPVALRGRLSQGTVVVKYFVDPQGKVRLPVVVSASDPAFGAAALAAIREWRYEPPRIDGRPVVALERHSFHFAVSEQR